jgi:hypothetical protein
VGARLARDESDAVFQRPRRLYRGQALLPQRLLLQGLELLGQLLDLLLPLRLAQPRLGIEG